MPSGKMKTDWRVVVMVDAAVSNAAREEVRFARSMKTVFERATIDMLDYVSAKE